MCKILWLNYFKSWNIFSVCILAFYCRAYTYSISSNSCLALLVLFWKLYICVFEEKYVLIVLAFFFIYFHNMLKLATDYFTFWRRHWLFTILVMCAATANVCKMWILQYSTYMDCINTLCNTIKTPLNCCVFVIHYTASPKHKVLFSATRKQSSCRNMRPRGKSILT